MAPAVSVVVTTYNQETFIAAAIESVLAQTFSDYEVIVVDDGSTDRTPQELARFEGRARIIRQPNQGIAGSRNTGIRQATGEFLAFLDGDDLWEHDKLERQVAAAREHPQSGLIVVDGVQFSGSEVRLPSLVTSPMRDRFACQDSVTLRCYPDIVARNPISTTSQIMIPRSVFDTVGLSNPAFAVCSDWDLYIRIAARYELTFLSQKLTKWRYLETSASGPAHVRQLRWGMDGIEVLKKHLRQSSGVHRPLLRQQLHRTIVGTAYAAYRHGRDEDRALGRRYLLHLVLHNPTLPAPLYMLIALHLPHGFVRVLNQRIRPLPGFPEHS